jgi:hypothetical protein
MGGLLTSDGTGPSLVCLMQLRYWRDNAIWIACSGETR